MPYYEKTTCCEVVKEHSPALSSRLVSAMLSGAAENCSPTKLKDARLEQAGIELANNQGEGKIYHSLSILLSLVM